MSLALQLPRRDSWTVIGSLLAVTFLCWAYLIRMAQESCCLRISAWNASYFGMMFAMWAIMMVGMMLPTVASTVLIYAGVARKAAQDGMPVASTGIFTAGYLFIWIIFSFLATVAQWQLDRFALLSPQMTLHSAGFGAALLIATGIYQQLPIKNQCL